MTLEEIVADIRRLSKEIDDELQTLAVAIEHAPPERRNELAQQYFRHILFMSKQNRMLGDKITSLHTARRTQSNVSIVQKRMLELITFQRKQLKDLNEYLHRLNLALAKEHSSKRGV